MRVEPRALRVLLLFVQRPGKLLQKELILEAVWKTSFVEESTLTRAVALLRKHLGDDPRAPDLHRDDRPGTIVNNPIGVLAYLQLGRAYVQLGDVPCARAAYADCMTL